ncbi:hypothetical protein GGU10DRAFT_333012 [Lentinula aff. detonsa]|uniref:Uncharacterized protein n=1 Tax=Lentinula aff. detonsa TaxID=2804958 RepID=A0AA38ND02_9AGAR|nr:hypothetical protein GGU10DRAFT_333012 [Lentinula aff. detonsa]
MSEILAVQTMTNFLQYLGRQVAHPGLNFRQVQNPSSRRIVEHSARKECSKSYTLHATGSRFETVYLRTEGFTTLDLSDTCCLARTQEDVGAFRSPTFCCLTITIEYIHVVQILSPNLNSPDNAYAPVIVMAVFSERQEPARTLPFMGGGVLHCQRGGKRACLLGEIPEKKSYLPQISASPASPSGHPLEVCTTYWCRLVVKPDTIDYEASIPTAGATSKSMFYVLLELQTTVEHLRQILTPFMTLPLFGSQF